MCFAYSRLHGEDGPQSHLQQSIRRRSLDGCRKRRPVFGALHWKRHVPEPGWWIHMARSSQGCASLGVWRLGLSAHHGKWWKAGRSRLVQQGRGFELERVPIHQGQGSRYVNCDSSDGHEPEVHFDGVLSPIAGHQRRRSSWFYRAYFKEMQVSFKYRWYRWLTSFNWQAKSVLMIQARMISNCGAQVREGRKFACSVEEWEFLLN